MSAIAHGGIIAAGEGSRLKRDGFAMPKALVPVGGVPLIDHAIQNFETAGIRRLAIIFNEADAACEAHVRARHPGLDLTVIVKTTPHSLASFQEVLAHLPPGRALLSTVDAFSGPAAFASFASAAARLPEEASALAVTPFVADENPLWVEVDEHGSVTRVGGASGELVTAGFYLVSERARQRVPPPLSRLREYLEWLHGTGERITGVVLDKVVDVDRGDDVTLAEEMLREGRSPALVTAVERGRG